MGCNDDHPSGPIEHCRELKLSRVFKELETIKRQADADAWNYEDFLVHLLELEVVGRRDATAGRRIREAKFPELKTLDQVDWTALGGISRAKIAELASCEFIDRHEDIVLAGPIGTGKTMISIAIGVEAARRRRVAFVRIADLVRDLVEARDDRQLGRLQKRFQRVDLHICDELGFVPFDKSGGELLFNLLADRYESRSTIITTNLGFGEWVQVFRNEKLTTALLDRIGHHAHMLTTKGALTERASNDLPRRRNHHERNDWRWITFIAPNGSKNQRCVHVAPIRKRSP